MSPSRPQQAVLIADTAPRVQVLVPFPVARAFDYRVPEGMAVAPGDYVAVPWGRAEAVGVVWSSDSDDSLPAGKVKNIIKKFDFPPMQQAQRQFVEWVARYTLADMGAVLKMCLGAVDALEPPARARKVVLPCMIDQVPENPLSFSQTQTDAANALVHLVNARKYGAVLLDGVTGSGKTEVYFEAVAAALKAGRQALILLPEISLSAQFLDRFKRRFGVEPALWHSEVTPVRKRNTLKGVATGETRVVLGARSALFLPFADLGVIVIDEEHEASYKQEDGVMYHARDMAVVRAHVSDVPIVLVSATPSLETMHNVTQGKYHYLQLPARHAGAQLPDVTVIDLKQNPPPRGNFIAPPLREALQTAFDAGEQSLLFLNRRGYAPLTLCRTCGYRFQCPSCSAWLVEHRRLGKLQCHHCGHARPLPPACPECRDEDSFAACGPGVERIEEEVRALLPDARTLILASDMTGTQNVLADAVKQVESGDVDIMIGTQIIAKGHHFPGLTCVGVVDADLGLAGGDLRAGERTFQLLHQVAGRAGRGEKPGHVYLQTYMPEQPVMQALAGHARDSFFDVETRLREKALMPPFGRLAALIISDTDEHRLDMFCRALAQVAPRFDDIRVLGPAPAPIAFLRNRHRRRFLVKTGRQVAIQKFISDWLAQIKPPSTVQLKVDIDPQSFF